MNVVFLLGNGFDLQLGLNSRYADFYDYYSKKPSTDVLVANLKGHINDFLEGKKNRLPDVNWEDLELALGKYTKELKSYEELRAIYLDINKELMVYLHSQERLFIRDESVCSKLRADFCRPEQYLSTNEKRRYHNLIDGGTGLNILNLNYTKCCETIFEKKGPDNNAKGNTTNLAEIAHVHGDLEMQNVLMGVNDISQIANETIRDDVRVKRMLVKPSTNDMLDNQRTIHLKSILTNAKVVVIYGASLGDTDLMWRTKLMDLLVSEKCYFLIYEYQEGFDNIFDQADAEDQAKVAFITKLGLGEEVEKYRQYVFVAVTKSMFRAVADK